MLTSKSIILEMRAEEEGDHIKVRVWCMNCEWERDVLIQTTHLLQIGVTVQTVLEDVNSSTAHDCAAFAFGKPEAKLFAIKVED